MEQILKILTHSTNPEEDTSSLSTSGLLENLLMTESDNRDSEIKFARKVWLRTMQTTSPQGSEVRSE